MNKPFSQACENNKRPILTVLQQAFANCKSVLEIGSGTGQHAVFFAASMPWLHWQPSDRAENLPGIRVWLESAALDNLAQPIELDVGASQWPMDGFDAVFSANTAHIMGWLEVESFIAAVGTYLDSGGMFCLYGPFNYGGRYTSASNAQFDAWLRDRDPRSAIRDFEAVDRFAQAAGLILVGDHAMPANNRTLVWQKAEPKL